MFSFIVMLLAAFYGYQRRNDDSLGDDLLDGILFGIITGVVIGLIGLAL